MTTILTELHGRVFGLDVDGKLTNEADVLGFGVPAGLPVHTVANAPDASDAGEGAVIYVSDGDSGSECLAVSDGTDWLVVSMGSAISDGA